MKEEISQVDIDEALEILWTLEDEGEMDEETFKGKFEDEMDDRPRDRHRRRFRHGYRNRIEEKILGVLKEKDLVKIDNAEFKLTEKGRRKAKNIVRRHRLAERFFVDLLQMGREEIEKPACEFEHMLSEEVTDRICTLLGHPRECPHGLPIPEGECCKTEKEVIKPVVKPLSKAEVGEDLEVAYIQTESHKRLHELLSYDVGPGSKIELHQKKPVYVIKTGETSIALEEDIVGNIYVKS